MRDAGSGDDRARSLQLMTQQTSRMKRLVEDLLTLSRLESTQNPPREEDVNVPELVRALHQDAQVLSAGRHRIAEARSAATGCGATRTSCAARSAT